MDSFTDAASNNEETLRGNRPGFRPMLPKHRAKLAEKEAELGHELPEVEDKSCGVIALHKRPDDGVVVVALLLLKSKDGAAWGFPKGHPDPGEEELAAANREFCEETGIDVGSEVVDGASYDEAYTFVYHLHSDAWKRHADYPDASKRPYCIIHKIVRYFVAVVSSTPDLIVQAAEVVEGRWVAADEALQLLESEGSRSEMLKSVLAMPRVVEALV